MENLLFNFILRNSLIRFLKVLFLSQLPRKTCTVNEFFDGLQSTSSLYTFIPSGSICSMFPVLQPYFSISRFDTDIVLLSLKFGFTKAEMLDITLCAVENSFADVKTRKQIKENIYKKMTAEDRREMKDLADKAKNPYLKKRLETRAAESEKVAKKLEIQKRRAKTMKTMKASRFALLAQKTTGR